MIDKEKFKENFKYYDKEVIVQVMDIFFGEYEDRLKELQKNITELDFDSLNHRAHSFKGVLAYISTELSQLCGILEVKGREKTRGGLQQTFDELMKGVLELVVELRELKKDYEG